MKTKARAARKAIPVHHTETDTGSWDGPKNEANLSNDDGASEYRKAFAWVDPDKDPDTKAAYKFIHHDVSSGGSVGAANKTACSATIAVLNGGRGGSTIPDADRQGVYDHVAAHLVDAGVEKDALPELKSRPLTAPTRQGYQPAPYHQDADETVTCPDCGRMNDTDASYCDQCGMQLTPTEDYSAKPDEDVRCPNCDLMNDDDAEYCDQCGIRLTGRDDVQIVGEGEPGVGDEYDSRRPPRENLLRVRVGGAVSLRTGPDGNPTTLYGFFSRFGVWYPVDSIWERGPFLERVMPGAFKDTIASDRAAMRVLFDHGMDPHLGFKPLGPIRTLEERDEGPYYEVPLLDTDYNRDFVIPALTGRLMDGTTVGSQLGASFRFTVEQDEWNRKPKASTSNPGAVPERSITRARVFEFGPVTFPANPEASAGMRSRSDIFVARLVGNPRFLADFTDRVGAKVAQRILDSVPEDLRAAMQGTGEPSDPEREARQRLLRRRARAVVTTAA